MPPWKWVVFVTWLFFAGFTIAFVGTSFGEGEPAAGLRGGLLFGFVTIVGAVGVWRVFHAGRRRRGEGVADDS
jgi:hypothetical protein